MKSVFVAIVVLSSIAQLFGQGSVDFRNTGSTQITTNNLAGSSGPTTGAGNYRMGLYTGPVGTPDGSLVLIGLGTNTAVAGLFDGGQVIAPFAPGSQVSFQVRAWSAFAGTSYEQATAYASGANNPAAYLGRSTTGVFTMPASGTVIIFGTGPGQVGGFVLTPVPEPATCVFAILALAGFFARRRK